MRSGVHTSLKNLIQQTDEAYNIYVATGQINTDFADFMSLCYNDFKSLLKRPDMTQRQLRRMVRKGCEDFKTFQSEDDCWATFMAQYIDMQSNSNMKK